MRIFHNLLYKIAALLVACVLWAATQGVRSVEEGIDVPVSLEKIPSDVVVVDHTPREVNLHIVGSRAALRRAERQLVRYPISLEGMKPGQARFAVETSHLPVPRGARVAARSPSAIVVELEERGRKTVPVQAELVGEPLPSVRIVGVDLEPSEVELEGARKALRRIRQVATDRIDVSGLAETEEREVRLALSVPHVWRAGGDRALRVHIRIEPIEPPDPPAEEEPEEAP